jgi:hypothetical protein
MELVLGFSGKAGVPLLRQVNISYVLISEGTT